MLQMIRIMAQWKNVIEVSYVVKGEKFIIHKSSNHHNDISTL